MPEQDYSAVVVDALSSVKGIQSGIDELVQYARADHEPQPVAELPAEVVEAAEAPAQMTGYEQQALGYMWMLSVTGVVVCAVLMLSLGVQLWQAFSDKWRA